MSTIKPENLAAEITKALQEYDKDVKGAVREAAKDAGEFCCKQIKASARSAFGGTGAYADSWTCDEKENSNSIVTYVVHSEAPYYRLTHLLEKGHTHWLWGKKQTQYRGRAHIRPAAELAKKKFENELKVKVQKR